MWEVGLRKYITVSFSEDLLQKSLEQAQESTVFVFPTHISASRARQIFMQNWTLQDCEFITMEQFRESLLLPSDPTVSDDRRMVCLFQALSPEHREYFHINGFFDIVEWGNQFFQFFEELCDENIDAQTLYEPQNLPGINLLEWQESYLLKVLEIRTEYRKILAQHGFSDPIFFQNIENAHLPHWGIRYVFVNQYYYSRLEQSLIDAVEAADNEIVIISQIGGKEQKDLDPTVIDLKSLEPEDYRLRNLEVLEFKNEDQAVLYFLANQAHEGDLSGSVLVDSKLNRASYRDLFDPRRFGMSEKQSIQNRWIYRIFHIFRQHLDAMSDTLGEGFLPLRLILDACSQEGFLSFYGLKPNQKNSLLDEIKVLLNSDILYVDNKLDLLDKFASPRGFKLMKAILEPHFRLLEKLSKLISPGDLLNLIDSPDGIAIPRLCSEEELQNSDILEVFYARLANFASLEKLGLVQNWQEFFDREDSRQAVSVLQLFLESLGSGRINFHKTDTKQKRLQISNLLDIRNLSQESVFFFHAIEGELPSSPNPVWLFNETQRGRLGLKSYPDLRERERYYFLRTVLSSEKCVIFTHRNLENDIEPGSFVTELIQAHSDGALSQVKLESKTFEPCISNLYRAWLAGSETQDKPYQDELCRNFGKEPERFFTLPSQPKSDLGAERTHVSGYYGLDDLLKNPFSWYIKRLRKIPDLDLRPLETISRKLSGAIMHDFLSKVLQPLAGRDLTLWDIEPHLTDVETLAAVLDDLLNEEKLFYTYKIPQNYNKVFLTTIIKNSLVDSIKAFYWSYLAQNLKDENFRLIPEQDRETEGGKIGKELLSIRLDDADFSVRIRGRADLRIKTPKRDLIIDFKTGHHDNDQLYFYEWLYYRLDNPAEDLNLSSLFWLLFESKTEKSPADLQKRLDWKNQVEDALVNSLTSGYSLGSKVADRQDLTKITRADLYRINKGGDQ